MFVRIVKLSFQEDRVSDFIAYFDTIKDRIRNFPGCLFLELYQDKKDPTIFFTYSYWEKEEDLELYKDSETFAEIWPFVKTLFRVKAEAWSVDKLRILE